jgi:hypothetical protein
MEAYHMTYKVEYLEKMAGDIPTDILPRRMDAYYTRYHVYTEISGFFNQFRLIQIADLRRRQVTSLLSFFGNKVYYRGETGQLPAGIAPLKSLKLTPTEDTLRIGGLLSERMLAQTSRDTFSLYYTRAFSVRRPNISTPYHSIDYPLTDFRIQLSILKMHATCTSLEEVTVESSLFQVPENYKEVNRLAMEEIINSLFTKD